MVETLMDEYSSPWQADWYRNRVKDKLGDRADDVYRLWYIDNAMHSTPSPGKDYARIISYTNVLQQALRDLSAWGGARRASAPDQQLSSTARWRCRRPPPSAAASSR